MIKNSLNDKKLLKLNQDEFFLYVIIKTLKYLNLKNISCSAIREILNKNLTDDKIYHLMKNLIKKKIIKPDEFTAPLQKKDKIKKLLLVDDEIHIFNLFKHVFKNRIIIDYAPDGKKGLSLFNQNSYDIIITDYNMPVMNGIEMINEIKKINNKIPVILLTGNRKISIKNIKTIYKPFNIKMIQDIISKL